MGLTKTEREGVYALVRHSPTALPNRLPQAAAGCLTPGRGSFPRPLPLRHFLCIDLPTASLMRLPRTPRWVHQEDALGCGIAALAMVMGRPYQDVRADFNDRDFSQRGIDYEEADDYLAQHGYATARVRCFYLDRMRSAWPPAPFASLHLCVVVCSPNSSRAHFVVMQEDGTVLDPATPVPRRLTDYFAVQNVAAVVPMPENEFARSGSVISVISDHSSRATGSPISLAG